MADDMVERGEIQPGPQAPIVETESSVSYLGVRLPKAQNRVSQFVPQREQYGDFFNDADLALPMQKTIAVAWLQGDPLLIEGGTSIGKSTTIRKMASELGYEIHYINLNGRTDVEDLMGKYIPNKNKRNSDDPEYTFADGKVTSGLRQEEGKIKVVVVDELNSADPNVIIRLHEVLDALERGESVVLSEDASEGVSVSKAKTKIVGLTNPPGKGYIGREPLDPAQLRRWIYYKAPSELPRETFIKSTEALFGLAPHTGEPDAGLYLPSRDLALLPEQLAEIPGMVEVLTKYQEFHAGAKQLVKERRVAADQPQLFTYDDRMEPRRVRNFVLAFYNGDINQTFQQALRFYYANKVESPLDKQKLEELITHVEYTPPAQTGSHRRPLDMPTPAAAPSPSPTPERPAEPIDTSEISRNEQREWNRVLGRNVEIKPLPDLSAETKEMLESLGFKLIFVPALDIGSKDTIKPIMKRVGGIAGFGAREEVEVGAEENYLSSMETAYPNWHRYEGLTDEQKADPKVMRNYQEWFWSQVKDGYIDFPTLPGKWLAVEKAPKPGYRESYADPTQLITEKLGLADRWNTSWDEAHNAIEANKRDMLNTLGIRTGDIKMLEALEWNLIGNREGWGATDTYEWTNTEYRHPDGNSPRVLAGRSGRGGASYANWDDPGSRDDRIGVRLAVVLEP